MKILSQSEPQYNPLPHVSAQTVLIGGRAYPLLPGYFDGGRQWFVPCNYCQKFHVHGAGPGHRCAHCDRPPAGPYEKSGYVLYLAGDWTTAVKQAWERWWIECRKAERAANRALKEQARKERMWDRAIERALRHGMPR